MKGAYPLIEWLNSAKRVHKHENINEGFVEREKSEIAE